MVRSGFGIDGMAKDSVELLMSRDRVLCDA